MTSLSWLVTRHYHGEIAFRGRNTGTQPYSIDTSIENYTYRDRYRDRYSSIDRNVYAMICTYMIEDTKDLNENDSRDWPRLGQHPWLASTAFSFDTNRPTNDWTYILLLPTKSKTISLYETISNSLDITYIYLSISIYRSDGKCIYILYLFMRFNAWFLNLVVQSNEKDFEVRQHHSCIRFKMKR
jgi:hypothetical protein